MVGTHTEVGLEVGLAIRFFLTWASPFGNDRPFVTSATIVTKRHRRVTIVTLPITSFDE
jgi:hypothetical protein